MQYSWNKSQHTQSHCRVITPFLTLVSNTYMNIKVKRKLYSSYLLHFYDYLIHNKLHLPDLINHFNRLQLKATEFKLCRQVHANIFTPESQRHLRSHVCLTLSWTWNPQRDLHSNRTWTAHTPSLPLSHTPVSRQPFEAPSGPGPPQSFMANS